MDILRTLARNQRKFHYCLLTGTVSVYDADGNATGETQSVYSEAVELNANISQATGYAQQEQFGQLDGYDKVIVFADPDTPIEESSVLFIDKEPEFRAETIYTMVDSDGENGETISTLTETEIQIPIFDYTVRRVARSLNSVSIAAAKVKIS